MKTDLTKEYKAYYSARPVPELVMIQAASYLSITGKGDPSGEDYATRLQSLYAVAYALKFMYKAKQQDFVVAKLEGLWWFDEARYAHVSMQEAPLTIPRSEWEYRLLIRLPAFVDPADILHAREQAAKKKALQHMEDLAYYEMEEGKCIQMMHTGPFDREPESLEQIRLFSEEHGLQKNGKHHEIYLSDFRKTAPEKLRTILREPVK